MHAYLKRATGVVAAGFTLTELMVALAILAVLAALATPPFTELFMAQRRRTAETALTAHLAMARVAAISRNQRVAVVPVEGDWDAGWQVFVDENADGLRADSEEQLAIHEGGEHVQIHGTGVLGSYVTFGPDGRPVQTNGAFLAGTFEICQAEGQGATRLVMSAAGRIRREDVNDDECTDTPDQ